MPAQTWQQTLVATTGDGTAVTGTVAGSLLLGAASPGVFTLPANFFDAPGKSLRVKAHGRVSNIVTTPGTLTLDLRFGAIIVATSAAMQLNAVAKTNVAWSLEWYLTARAVGSGTLANLMHNGSWSSESVVGSALPAAGGPGSHILQPSAPAVGTGFSSVVSNAVDLFAKFSLTGNSIQCHSFQFESSN